MGSLELWKNIFDHENMSSKVAYFTVLIFSIANRPKTQILFHKKLLATRELCIMTLPVAQVGIDGLAKLQHEQLFL